MARTGGVAAKAWRVGAAAVTSGGRQNFLGARWVPALIERAPLTLRTRLALRMLALSPHYFFDPDLEAEHSRCLVQREGLTEQLLAPVLTSAMTVMDYGCGPGYMAVAVARRVQHVEAIDISSGVLACARVLNPAPNVTYETSAEAGRRQESVDLAYSFAVVQHLTDETFRSVLELLRRRLRPGGKLVLHFALPIDGWRTEPEWQADESLQGKLKLRFGLNCFGRGPDHVERLVTEAGFENVTIEPLAGRTDADDDIAAQHWLIGSAAE